MEERNDAERVGETILAAVAESMAGKLAEHREYAVEEIVEAVGRRLEMAHAAEAVSLLDIAIRREELAEAESALRCSSDPAATKARAAILAADDLLRRFSNAIVEHARAAGATVAVVAAAAAALACDDAIACVVSSIGGGG